MNSRQRKQIKKYKLRVAKDVIDMIYELLDDLDNGKCTIEDARTDMKEVEEEIITKFCK